MEVEWEEKILAKWRKKIKDEFFFVSFFEILKK